MVFFSPLIGKKPPLLVPDLSAPVAQRSHELAGSLGELSVEVVAEGLGLLLGVLVVGAAVGGGGVHGDCVYDFDICIFRIL